MTRSRTTATIADAIATKQAAKVKDAGSEAAALHAPSVVCFVVEGEPVGKERARVFRNVNADGRVVTRAVTPEKTRAYEAKLRVVAQIAVNQSKWAWSKEDRFSVIIRIYRTWVDRGPDVDNIAKTCDALNGIVWHDDRHVWAIAAALRKRDPKRPRVEFEIRRFHKDRAL